MRIGLYCGSFNPIHTGHLIVANVILSQGLVDEIWFVVSPQNPLKDPLVLAPVAHRLKMVELALKDSSTIKPCDIELRLPLPSYTVNTLKELSKKHPLDQFSLILGSDALQKFDQWKDSDYILAHYRLILYARPGSNVDAWMSHPSIMHCSGPSLDISSTWIRNEIKENHSIKYAVPQAVETYILQNRLYKNST